jgi:Fur family ferric uptake transcriptional regulator
MGILLENMSMNHILTQFKIKKTLPREVVLAILSFSKDPARVDDILLQAKKMKGKTPDPVTIYRTLETFKKAGIVREVVFKDKVSRYELVGEHGEHCHHAVCSGCGVTEHIEDPAIEKALHTLSKKFKNVTYVKEHVLEFFGLCKKCNVK